MIERAFTKPDIEPAPQTQTEVLDNAITWYGKPVEDVVLNQLAHNALKLVVVSGAPRAGKTTFGNQLGDAIQRASDGHKKANYLYFDNIIKEKQVELGPVTDWGVDEWREFSVYHYKIIETQLESSRNGDILIAETVSIGKTDRGLTTLEMLGKEHRVDAFFIPVIGDPRIDEADVTRRLAVLAKDKNDKWVIRDEDLIKFYADQNLLVTGWEGLSEVEAGRRLREAVGRMDRPRGYRIWNNRNRAQVEEIVADYIENGVPQGRERLPELDELLIATFAQRKSWISEHPRPQQVIDASSDPWVIDRFNILLEYYWGQEIEHMNIQRGRFVPAINLLLENTPIHYLDLSKLRED